MIDFVKKLRAIWTHRSKSNPVFTSSIEESSAEEPTNDDLPKDLPSTVTPLTAHDRQVAEARKAFSGQRWTAPKNEDDNIYIWRKADEYIKQWLSSKEYKVLESAVFEDCIGYRCNRRGYAYTVFMYAYGERKTTLLDGEYCNKLKSLPFAQNSMVLVVYLKVDRKINGNNIEYKVGRYGGTDAEPDLWRLNEIDGKPILEYYVRKEMADQLWQFMYAFNHEDTDVYDCIITDDNPSIECGPEYSRVLLSGAFYNTLKNLHREYGDMKLGYVRVNDVIYCSVPYIENLGFFSWSSYQATNRMHDMGCHPFDGGKLKIEEFVATNWREPEDLFAHIPMLVAATPLSPVSTERFAVKIFFDNGECRKYVLPISDKDEGEDVLSYRGYVFTEGIWQSVSVVSHRESKYPGYPECGAALVFKNGFTISGMRCYMNSTLYSEPEQVDKIVYTDDKCQIRKLWKWNVNSLYEDNETGLLKVLISGQAFNWYGKSVFASVDGRRLTSLNFDIINNFNDGLARVAINGHGYGFVDRDMNFVVPMRYDGAEDFVGGRAKVRLGDQWFFVDQTGRTLPLAPHDLNTRYEEVGDYAEGLCRVSTLKLRFMDLAYHSDHDEIAGTWGFVDEIGKEVIAPQYIYANDFENGIAIVAKGKWTIDPKWDNKCNQGRYWTEEELWGGIDKNGNEVIPCIFDEIKYFWDCDDMYMAHIGGWKNGHWGVIDQAGNWLAEPVFEDFAYDYYDGLIIFYAQDKWSGPDDIPMGIYDLKQKKVLFEPQFLEVSFLENGDIAVEIFDEELERRIEKIIDRSGKERFKSVYSSIYTWKEPYEVVVRDIDGDKRGLIDREGNIVLPCKCNVSWGGILHDQRRIIFEENGKQGVVDYNGNVIIPAIYYKIYGSWNPFLTVQVGEKDSYKESLITADGTEVIPPKYKHIGWCRDRKHFYCCSDGCCEMYLLEAK